MGSWCPLCVFVASGNPGDVLGALFTASELREMSQSPCRALG